MQSTVLETPLQRKDSQSLPRASCDSLNGLPSLRGVETLLDLCTGCFSFAVACDISKALSMQAGLGNVKHLVASALVFSIVVILLLDRSGTYRASGGLLRVRETASVLEASLLAFVLLGTCVLLFGDGALLPFVALGMAILTISLMVQKHLLHAAIDALRESGYGLRRVLIYGTGSTASLLFSALSRSPKLGLLPVAMIQDDGTETDGLPVYESGYRKKRSLVRLAANFHASLVRAYQVDIVIVATRPASEQALRNVMDESARAGASVAFAADSAARDSPLVDFIELDGQLLYGAHRIGPRYLHQVASRTIDLLASGILLILISPLLGLISLFIRFDSKGPILYRQQRIGKNGRPFTILKFRSMHTNLCGDHVSPDSSRDPRITRVGRWLRRTSLDELPQLLNILQGDMALVGPRPEMPFIVAGYSESQRQRLCVRPGLTGLWQISADRCRPIHENIQYDLYYIQNRSIFMDVAILFHTVLFAMNGT